LNSQTQGSSAQQGATAQVLGGVTKGK
jgi:hypothetical protein